MPWFVWVFITFSVFLLISAILSIFLANYSPISRLHKYITEVQFKSEELKSHKNFYRNSLKSVSKVIGGIAFFSSYKKSLQDKLARANILLKAEEFITVSLALSFVFFLSGTIIKGNSFGEIIFYGGLGFVCGWVLPIILLNSAMKKRLKELNDQLVDTIVLISNSLKAGFSFFQTIDTVVKEMRGPIAQEFAIMQREIGIGISTEKALENLVTRVSSDDLELIITAVLIQRQVGGNLSEVLDNISTTIRERIKLKGEIKTVTAQGKMSGIVISILPFILGFVLFLINPSNIMLLFTNIIGIGILIFSVIMEIIGIFIISRIIKIEI
jgi:tight adherence protein B